MESNHLAELTEQLRARVCVCVEGGGVVLTLN